MNYWSACVCYNAAVNKVLYAISISIPVQRVSQDICRDRKYGVQVCVLYNITPPPEYHCLVQSCRMSSRVSALRGHSPQERAASSMTPLQSVQRAAPVRQDPKQTG